MHLEFTSARPPGPARVAAPPLAGSYWPGGAALAAGFVVLTAGRFTDLPAGLVGNVLVVTAGGLLGRAFLTRRQAREAAPRWPAREPRQWTITEDDLCSGNRLGSVRVAWSRVGRVLVLRDVYLLYHDDTPDSYLLDVPRDGLTPDRDAELRAFLTARGLLAPD